MPGTTTAVAYPKLLKLMKFVQSLGGACAAGSYNRQFAVWYGWSNFSPGYGALKNFWESLPATGCNLRASYVTWLDTRFTGIPEVQQLQRYVVKQLNQPYWVNTELYSTAQIERYRTTFASTKPLLPVFTARTALRIGPGECAGNGNRPRSRIAWAYGRSPTTIYRRAKATERTSTAPWRIFARFVTTELIVADGCRDLSVIGVIRHLATELG